MFRSDAAPRSGRIISACRGERCASSALYPGHCADVVYDLCGLKSLSLVRQARELRCANAGTAVAVHRR